VLLQLEPHFFHRDTDATTTNDDDSTSRDAAVKLELCVRGVGTRADVLVLRTPRRCAPPWAPRSAHALSRRVALVSKRVLSLELTDDGEAFGLEASLRAALRAQPSLPPRLDEEAFVAAALYVASDGLLPEDAVRGLLRLHALTGLTPEQIALSDCLSTPTEKIVGLLLLLRALLPAADLTRVLAALPLGELLRDDGSGEPGTDAGLTSLRYCAEGALCELQLFMPQPVAQLIAEETPMILFGALSLADVGRLRDAWQASGSSLLSEKELAKEMKHPNFSTLRLLSHCREPDVATARHALTRWSDASLASRAVRYFTNFIL